MRLVAAPLSAADRTTLQAAYRCVFRRAGELDVDALPDVGTSDLAHALPEANLAQHAARFLAVMALVDGAIDPVKIARVEAYAAALGVHADDLRQLAEAAAGHLQWVAMDMMRQNVQSIPGLAWNAHDVAAIFLPYGGASADAGLARRDEALGALPTGTVHRAFSAHDRHNGYPFPGEADGLNDSFATPHDSTHVPSGCDTTPRGELLVSTFTAAMHKQAPMSGHILPVIFGWHLGIQLNDAAKSAVDAFDPAAFWLAWDRGAAATVDTFAAAWDFWSAVAEPLVDRRRAYGIPPLEPGADATQPLLRS